MPGRFPLFTDENIDGPIIRGLRQRGWDVLHATRELGEETKDAPLFQLAASLDRVFVSTDRHMLQLAKKWLEANRPFRMIWWEQSETQRVHVFAVLDAFEDLAAQDNLFVYPIAYLKLPKSRLIPSLGGYLIAFEHRHCAAELGLPGWWRLLAWGVDWTDVGDSAETRP